MIDGIYNYCDRWCERCPFTSRCANFALEEQYFPDPQDRDIRNQRFWDKLHEVFRTTLDMLRKDAEAGCPPSHVGGYIDGVDGVDGVDWVDGVDLVDWVALPKTRTAPRKLPCWAWIAL